MTKAQLKHWFTYHPPKGDDPKKYEAIREAGLAFAEVVCDHTPECADQTVAVRKIREAVATANAAIACEGK